MWLITNQGFYSAVAHRDDPDLLLVRARAKADIDALAAQIPDIKPFRDATADYPWRAEVTRADWARAVATLALDIDYDNFKSSVKDAGRHNLYMKVWSALLAIELEDGKGHWQRQDAHRAAHAPLDPLFPLDPYDRLPWDDDVPPVKAKPTRKRKGKKK